MSSLKFDNIFVNGSKGINVLTVDQAQGDLKIKWPSNLGQYYTVVMYDLDAPYPGRPNKSPFLHYLVVNVQDNSINSGQTLAKYISPYPPTDSPPHRYVVEVYVQQNLKTDVTLPSSRDNFDVRKYANEYGDEIISSQQFKVSHILPTVRASLLVSQQYVPTPVPQTFVPTPVPQTYVPTPVPQRYIPTPVPKSVPPYTQTFVPPSVPQQYIPTNINRIKYVPFEVPTNNPTNTHSNSNKPEYFKDETDLGEHQQKYCRCVLHAAAKQPDWCLEDKAWRDKREGATCYNPYAVCAKSTGTSSRSCGSNYDYQNFPDDELISYARLSKVHIPLPYNRQQMINNIMAWKAGES
jgi:phosphatidylethanolamine-binding protein (PEBP) family uncharacterized protein